MPSKIVFRGTLSALECLEKKFNCNACCSFATSPVTLGGCEHVFCSGCCEGFLGGACPVCAIPSPAKDADVDRQLFTLASLCLSLREVIHSHNASNGAPHEQHDVEDNNIQCTPNQPIPGSRSHDSHVTAFDHAPMDSKNSKSDLDSKRPVRRKKTTESNEITKKEAVELSSVDNLVQTKGLHNTVKNKATSLNNSKQTGQYKRRRTLPADQSTMTQFFECDDVENAHYTDGNVDDVIDETDGNAHMKAKGSRASKIKGKSGVTKSKRNTRLRHSLDSKIDMVAHYTEAEKDETNAGIDSDMTIPSKLKSVVNSRRLRSYSGQHYEEDGGKNTVCNETLETPTVNKRRSSVYKPCLNSPDATVTASTGSIDSTPVGNSGRRGVSTPKLLDGFKGVNSAASTPVSRVSALSTSPLINKRNAKGEYPLHVAVIKNDVAKARELLELGASPNVQDNAGWTPLHEACNHGYLDLASLLLDHCALINIPGHENDTPLHDSIVNNRVDCVKLLVSRGASLTLRNMHGLTAHDLATSDDMRDALQTPVLAEVPVDSQFVDTLEYQAPCLLGTGLTREEKVQLQKAGTMLHVKLSDEVTPEVTHIITKVNKDGMCPRTIKTVLGTLTGKWILNMEWLETSLAMGRLVCEEAFEVPGTSLFPNSQAPMKGRKNRQKLLPGLFHGCKFYFHGSFEFAQPSKDDLTQIITVAEGTILTREPKPGYLDNNLTVPYHADPSCEFANICVFIVHEKISDRVVLRNKNMCSVTSAWIMDSACNFQFMPLPCAQL
ncbi:BRCA1-associated RING domain protein 1-like [Dreissena polymorpha]|uniref:BRCA1-associated RING domain protein 1 n=1 Tax=Dreissena polymorpha TaxID=45954 RepID=A0A9D4HJX3_DREPO|nr:BRCA1-associated RING domain protein 1-like [Dreissena polymorpha]KAH3719316.1 hypothetical protein DPMN_062147 [Dreissena polymorpha]